MPHLRQTTLLLGIGFAICAGASLPADDAKNPATSKREASQKPSLKLMNGVVSKFRVTTNSTEPAEQFIFIEEPLLHYNDLSRSIFDAGVWRLGKTGRPTALLTLEIYSRQPGTYILNYEFLSLKQAEFALSSAYGPGWQTNRTDLKMAVVPNSDKPSQRMPVRLTQMRRLARRFAVSELIGKEVTTCRLMPQPLDRYSAENDGITDGALFVFANGTNPELVLLLECKNDQWMFGAARLSSAELTVRLDDTEVIKMPRFTAYGPTNPYTASRHAVELPD